MKRAKILWADDEIELLKPYVLFLNEKGFDVVEVNSGLDAIDKCNEESFDLIFLDEHMPGISGLETLSIINQSFPDTPIVMITKSEDEGIMEKAIGRKIADYLIKPVNPHQILLSIKKILEKQDIIFETNIDSYRDEFNKLSEDINRCSSAEGWMSIYKRLVSWDIAFTANKTSMNEVLQMQKSEANTSFGKFIKSNYSRWFNNPSMAPTLSHNIFDQYVFPALDKGEKLFFILIDNFRLDQWMVVKELLSEIFTMKENLCFSILPTATQYARNAIFSGITPLQISKQYPHLWVGEEEDSGKNLEEEALIATQFATKGRKESFSYHKINSNTEGDKLVGEFHKLENNDLNIIVFNFIDMLSHARTELKMLQDLTPNEAAYRSLSKSWFQHSPLMSLFKLISQKKYKVLFTADHGTIRVRNPLKVIAERSINSNPRYKVGRNITYDSKKVFEITNPEQIGLPSPNLSTRYIFALNDNFFAFPNNFNQYVSLLENSFQHGGVSMEEMMVPIVQLETKQ